MKDEAIEQIRMSGPAQPESAWVSHLVLLGEYSEQGMLLV